MHAARATRLGPTAQPHLFQQRLHFERDESNTLPFHTWTRIEIDTQLIRMIEIFRTHWMRMKLDATEIDDPDKSRRIVYNNFISRASRRKRQRNGAQPLRMILRRALLVEDLTLGAVDETLQHDGSIANARKRARCDRQIILNELEFGELRVEREVRLVRIRNANLAPVDRQYFFFSLGHGSQRFRHVDEMGRNFRRHVFGEWACTVLDVTALFVERRQLVAKTDDDDIHRV